MNNINDRGLVVAFYSFKGGVGRSLALANVAELLAAGGGRVIACDFDLEAPGLERYFASNAGVAAEYSSRPGLVDLLEGYKLALEDPRSARPPDPQPEDGTEDRDGRVWLGGVAVPRPFARTFVPGEGRRHGSGELRLLTAGSRSEEDLVGYSRSVRRLDWREFYETWAGDAYLDLLRKDLAGEADFVLLDSRTGIAELGGVCTHHLADVVVLLTNTTEGCMESTERMARTLGSDALARSRGGRAPQLLPVAARVETTSETNDLRRFRTTFRSGFSRYVSRFAGEPTEFLKQSEIPYVPWYAFGERVIAREGDTPRSEELLEAYVALANGIRQVATGLKLEQEQKRKPSSPRPRRVFVCYRREDVGQAAARLADELALAFGDDCVFRDESSIDAGEVWPYRLRRELEQATVVLALIGDQWLKVQHPETYRRRLDMEGDWVRNELGLALERGGTTVIPVVVDGASLPSKRALEGLPELQPLADLQACRLRRTDWRADLEQIVVLLQARGFRAGKAVPDVPRREPIAAYREYLLRVHEDLVPFFEYDRERRLSEVFVELELDLRNTGPSGAVEPEGSLDEPSGSPDEPRALRSMLEKIGIVRSLEDLLLLPRQEPLDGKFVVLGDPGAGKSTTARHLAWTLAGRENGPLPVYVSLTRYARERVHPFNLAEDDVRAALGDLQADGLAAALADVAESSSDDGRGVWFLLDGLDEVGPDHRDEVRSAILGLAAQFGGPSRVVVFSRPIGFRALGADFAQARLRSLDDRTRRELLLRWLGPRKGAEIWDRLATRPALAAVLGNPLMLTLVAKLGMERPDLPTNLRELLREAIDLLLTRGFAREPKPVQDPALAWRLLAVFALKLQESSAETWSRDELSDALLEVLEAHPSLTSRLKIVWGTPAVFLADMADPAGILAPLDGPTNPWRFFHRSFRDFLAARCLRDREPSEILQLAAGLDEDRLPRWGETFGFLVGLMDSPVGLVKELQTKSPELVLRALPEAEFANAREGRDLLLGTKGWDGHHLATMAHGWPVDRNECEALLWELVTPSRTVEELAFVHWALESRGSPPDRERFFRACGRWPERGFPEVEFRRIPAGSFLMGSSDDESEQPIRRVELAEFELAVHPVTESRYVAFDPSRGGSSRGKKGQLPVTNVNWWEAYLFCRWLGGMPPTEAQWEYACRAGTNTRYWSGDDEKDLADVGWYSDNSGGRVHPVGQKRANDFGLYDMHGNVWEWCRDSWHDNYEGAPDDGSAWEEDGASNRVQRGGSFSDDADYARSANRVRDAPGFRYRSVGFRPARRITP